MMKALTDKNIETLAEMQYLAAVKIAGEERLPGQEVDVKTREGYIRQVKTVLDNLGKLEGAGYEPRPVGEYERQRKVKTIQRAQLVDFIKGWITKNVKKPDGAARLFPCEELGTQILIHFEKMEQEKGAAGEHK